MAGLSAALFALNAAIAWPLFRVEYLSQTGTGESVTIAYARYARDHWPDFDWCRFWYAGLPFRNAYVPALHLTAAAVSWLSHLSAASAFHHVAAFLYCFGPVTLFWMAWRLSGSASGSFCAALAYSLISPSAFLATEIGRDLGSPLWDQRLHSMVVYADNPHVAALALLPLAILVLDVALEKRRPFYFVAAAVALAAVPLTNWPGAIGLAFAVLAYGLAQTGPGGVRRWLLIGAVAALAYAFAIPWIPPSTILATQRDAQAFAPVNRFAARHLIYAVALAALVWALMRLLSAVRTPRYLRFFALFFFFFAAITLGWYWLGLTLLAQPNRFHLETEMGFTLGVVFAARMALARWPAPRRPVVAVFAIACAVQFVQYRAYARRLIHGIDITQTSEYKTARWFDQHMRDSRVEVPGSTSFWLNVFTDTPQLTGCCPQGVLNQTARVADYGIMTDLTAENRAFENSLLWFKALGVRAVAVSGPRSTEVYKPFYHPAKFGGKLRVLWRDGDDVIYEVPWRYYSIAHAISSSDAVARTPAHGVDTQPLVPYVEAIDRPDAPQLQVQWLDNETMRITGDLQPRQIVSVQENMDSGWSASANGSPRSVYADKLGLIAIEPYCQGHCTIELHYNGGIEMQCAHWINRGALAGSLLWMLLGLARRPKHPQPTTHNPPPT